MCVRMQNELCCFRYALSRDLIEMLCVRLYNVYIDSCKYTDCTSLLAVITCNYKDGYETLIRRDTITSQKVD